ncbi:Zinc finger, PHD-type, partial [Parasponia andersonii]
MENQHFCRQRHILLLIRDSKISNDHLLCEICNSLVAAPYYVCDSCKYYAHKSCTELPRQINHSIHPRHPLTLLTQKVFFCDSCKQNFKNTLCFSCIQCNFDLDVECAQMSNSITCPEGQEHSIRHSSHPHLLRHIERKINKDIKIECFACKSKALDSSSGVYYGCIRCNYFLHKTCIDELPQEILNTLHPHHGPLTLYARLFKCTCRLCDKKENHTFSYECPQCDFRLCVQCCLGEVRRTIRYEDHEHLLCFVEKIYTKLGDRCNAYNTNCNLPIISNCTEFDATISSAFRCLDCDFVLHLLCGPLPSTIKHEFHTDPLVLVELLIDDDSGEFYCDVCETERNPRIRAYYCHKCKYIVHVHCVISEIKNVLSGDLIDVKLKTVGEDIWTLPIEIDNAGVEALIELGRSFL